jgi:hypothetical protein
MSLKQYFSVSGMYHFTDLISVGVGYTYIGEADFLSALTVVYF